MFLFNLYFKFAHKWPSKNAGCINYSLQYGALVYKVQEAKCPDFTHAVHKLTGLQNNKNQ